MSAQYVYVAYDTREVDGIPTMEIFREKEDAIMFCKSMGTVIDWEIIEKEIL